MSAKLKQPFSIFREIGWHQSCANTLISESLGLGGLSLKQKVGSNFSGKPPTDLCLGDYNLKVKGLKCTSDVFDLLAYI